MDRKQKQILDKITPLIQKIADERVQAVMVEISKQQIKQYEAFFEGQEERLDREVNKHIDERLEHLGLSKEQIETLITAKINNRLKELGVLK